MRRSRVSWGASLRRITRNFLVDFPMSMVINMSRVINPDVVYRRVRSIHEAGYSEVGCDIIQLGDGIGMQFTPLMTVDVWCNPPVERERNSLGESPE